MKIATLLLVASALLSAEEVQPALDLKALAKPLQDLTSEEATRVNQATKLIAAKQHLEAFALLTSLTASNPKNSSLRIMRAYVLLELGNVTGALTDAGVAEASGGHAAYKCWFLAQIAYRAGNKPFCRREVKHLRQNPIYGPQAEDLLRALDARPR